MESITNKLQLAAAAKVNQKKGSLQWQATNGKQLKLQISCKSVKKSCCKNHADIEFLPGEAERKSGLLIIQTGAAWV